MKKIIVSIPLLFILFLACLQQKNIDSNSLIQIFFKNQSDTLVFLLNDLDSLCQQKDVSVSGMKKLFYNSRNRYKTIETVVEYYFQGHVKRINGPALPDVKTDDNQVFPPHGFQVIEQMIWAEAPTESNLLRDLQKEIRILVADIKFVQVNLKEQTILARHIREMVQHEFIRIATAGITGLDAPVSFASITEALYSLKGIQSLLNTFSIDLVNSGIKDSVELTFNNTINYLTSNNDFNSFDRLEFIRSYLMPLSKMLKNIPKIPDEELIAFKKPFDGTLGDLMEGRGFNPDYYSPFAITKTSPEKVSLGKDLFYDTRLSSNNLISCGTCHQPEMFFSDGKKVADNFVHGGKLQRNTPGLYYSSLQAAQFYDMRTSNLEEQIHDVMSNKKEFNLTSDKVSFEVNKSGKYKNSARKIFGKDSLTSFEIRNAIASYVRSLNPFNSEFDRYMKREIDTFPIESKRGFNIFMGKAKCGTCHFAPVFNGTLPPWFTKAESEIIGVPGSISWERAVIDQDIGRYALNQLEPLRFAFKTPSIRNIEMTPPYMHNGVYNTLEQVVEFYKKGGGVGIGINLPYQSLPFDSLQLTSSEKNALVSFMKSLTDRL